MSNMTNSTCIPNLMRGTHATCSELKISSTQIIELVDEGINLLNAFNGIIIKNCSDNNYNLNGTFMLILNNCSHQKKYL